MKIAFFGSSLLSSYWNGAATYYRGIIAALARRGHTITFYEPDAFGRQEHRDIEQTDWVEVVVFAPTITSMRNAFSHASGADVFVKASGVGVLDDEILVETVIQASKGKITVFWDVDAPATLADVTRNPNHLVRRAVKRLDCVLTYGGGLPVVDAYLGIGAQRCVPIYNALDPETHFPVMADARFEADLAFLGNRLPDREERVNSFFFEAARLMPDRTFLLAGAGWEAWQLPPNVTFIGHLPTNDHNAFNCSPRAVINISRNSMANMGFSPATRVFEAAGAGACLISDTWPGIEQFLAPDEEIILAQSGADVANILSRLTFERARRIGRSALSRVRRDHTYDRRAVIVDQILADLARAKEQAAA